MEVDPDHGGNNGNDGFKIAELERRLTVETDRYHLLQSQSELSKFVSGQEVGKWRRENLSLRETVSRLKEDCNRLRERELKDQETIKNLLEEMEAKEREFSEKFVELKVENRDLECAKRRAQDEAREWKKKYEEAEATAAGNAKGKEYGEPEARVLKLVGENFHLVEKEKGVENGNAEQQSIKRKRKTETDQELTKKTAEGLLSIPKPRRKRVLVAVDSDSGRGGEGDGISLTQLIKKRHAEVAAEKDSGSPRESSAQRCTLGKLRTTGAKRSESAKVGGARIQSAPGNNTQKVADGGLRAYKKRNSRNQMSRRKYAGPLASFQVLRAEKRAKTLQRNLNPFNPSFIKTMALSHVSGCFWLGLPQKFCKKNLPCHALKMKLEDEKGSEYKVNYIGKKKCLSAGWKGFALAHKLEIGDALIFELIELATFKVYIVKAIPERSSEDFDDEIAGRCTDGATEQEKH